MKPLFKKGDVVTVFQMHPREGLLIEGRATVLKSLSADDWPDEHYRVRFHDKKGTPMLGEEYDRFVDREGQANPTKYVRDTNRRLGMGKR
jgi:hypothetical protein